MIFNKINSMDKDHKGHNNTMLLRRQQPASLALCEGNSSARRILPGSTAETKQEVLR